MTTRITQSDLENLAAVINEMTNSPATSATRDDKGKVTWHVGNYLIDYDYGGATLHRISNDAGGVTLPLGFGYHSKAELHKMLYAFIQGLSMKVSA